MIDLLENDEILRFGCSTRRRYTVRKLHHNWYTIEVIGAGFREVDRVDTLQHGVKRYPGIQFYDRFGGPNPKTK